MRLDELEVLYLEEGTGKRAIGKIVSAETLKIKWNTEEELLEYDSEFFNEHFKIIPKVQELP